MIRSLRRTLLATLVAGLALAPSAHAATFSSPSSIDVPDEAAANPWPATVAVSGMVGEVTDLDVTLDGLTHTHLDDVGVVVQAPSGEALMLMNGVGPIVVPSDPTSGVSNVDITLDDSAATQLQTATVPTSGSYRPANHAGIDNFSFGGTGPGTTYSNPGPVGANGTATLANTFNGIDPNGSWKLWVHDFAQGDVGEIADGWSVDVVTDGVDDTDPVTTITSGPSGTINTDAATFEFTANEQATFACKLDGGAYGSCTSPKQYSGLAEGTHTFTVRATDTAGNVEGSPPSRTFTVDLVTPPPPPPPPSGGGGGGGGGPGADGQAPTVTITGVKLNRRKRTAAVSFTGSDNVTAANALTFACSLDGKAAKPCSSPNTYKRLKPGRHTVEVRAGDAAGNSSAPASKSFKVKKKKRR